jgi:hypothetical protein
MSLTFAEERQLKTFDSMIQLALTGFKLMVLLNGGAAVALLAYLGNITGNASTAATGTVLVPPDLRAPMVFFILGLICCMAAVGLGYRTQYFLAKEVSGTAGYGSYRAWFVWGSLLFAASIACFGIGAFWAAARF